MRWINLEKHSLRLILVDIDRESELRALAVLNARNQPEYHKDLQELGFIRNRHDAWLCLNYRELGFTDLQQRFPDAYIDDVTIETVYPQLENYLQEKQPSQVTNVDKSPAQNGTPIVIVRKKLSTGRECILVQGDTEKYKDRILSAVPGIQPLIFPDESGYVFQVQHENTIRSALYDIAGTSPLYFEENLSSGLLLKGNLKIAHELLNRLDISAPYSHIDRGFVVNEASRFPIRDAMRTSISSSLSASRPQTTVEPNRDTEPDQLNPTAENALAKYPLKIQPYRSTDGEIRTFIITANAGYTIQDYEQDIQTATNKSDLRLGYSYKYKGYILPLQYENDIRRNLHSLIGGPLPKNTPDSGMSFHDYVHLNFNNDPYQILDHYSSDISKIAETLGIDWENTKDNVTLDGANGGIGGARIKYLRKEMIGKCWIVGYENKTDSGVNWPLLVMSSRYDESKIKIALIDQLKEDWERDKDNELPKDAFALEKQRAQATAEAEKRRQNAREQAEKDEKRRQNSRDWWQNNFRSLAAEDGTHGYLAKKGISDIAQYVELRRGTDFFDNADDISKARPADDPFNSFTAYEIYTLDGDNRGIQKLYADSAKKLIYGTEVEGACIMLGNHDPNKPIYVTEGFATGASIYLAERSLTIVALFAQNLLAVVRSLRQYYPDSEIRIAADNDNYKPHTGNPGMRYALATAFECNTSISTLTPRHNPPFKSLLDAQGKAIDEFALKSELGLPIKNAGIYIKTEKINDSARMYLYAKDNTPIVDSNGGKIEAKHDASRVDRVTIDGVKVGLDQDVYVMIDYQTDFNDVHVSDGIQAVSKQLSKTIPIPKTEFDLAIQQLKHSGTDNVRDFFDSSVEIGKAIGISENALMRTIFHEVKERFGMPFLEKNYGSDKRYFSHIDSISNDDPLDGPRGVRHSIPFTDSSYPLLLKEYENKSGQIKSFIISAKDDNVYKYRDRILEALPDLTPIFIAKQKSYIFPLPRKSAVKAALYDLLGTAPLYISNSVPRGRPGFISIKGQIDTFRERIESLSQKIEYVPVFHRESNSYIVPEKHRFTVRAALSDVLIDNINYAEQKTSEVAKYKVSDQVTFVVGDNSDDFVVIKGVVISVQYIEGKAVYTVSDGNDSTYVTNESKIVNVNIQDKIDYRITKGFIGTPDEFESHCIDFLNTAITNRDYELAAITKLTESLIEQEHTAIRDYERRLPNGVEFIRKGDQWTIKGNTEEFRFIDEQFVFIQPDDGFNKTLKAIIRENTDLPEVKNDESDTRKQTSQETQSIRIDSSGEPSEISSRELQGSRKKDTDVRNDFGAARGSRAKGGIRKTSNSRETSSTENIELPRSSSIQSMASNPSRDIDITGTVGNASLAGHEYFVIDSNNYQKTYPKKEKLAKNIQILELIKKIKSETRLASSQEKKLLSEYSGWGGLPEIFDNKMYALQSERNHLKDLLTEDEFVACRSSVNTSHYTPPEIIRAMWKGLQNLGFHGGKILDPALGTGNFIGCAPLAIRQSSDFYGVELDHVSAAIAETLYNETTIKNTPFEKSYIPKDHFDTVVANVPFGNYQIFDPEYKKMSLLVHDYFILKSIDSTKSGGLIAIITSTGTLDKVNNSIRKEFYKSSDLILAIRLPNTTFKSFTNTSVTSDILFFRKRTPGDTPLSDSWLQTKDITLPFGNINSSENIKTSVNKYFIDNPDNILGEMFLVQGKYGAEKTVKGDSSDILGIINALTEINSLKTNNDSITNHPQNKKPAMVAPPTETGPYKFGSYFYDENTNQFSILSRELLSGDIQNNEFTAIPIDIPDKHVDALKSMIRLKNQIILTINAQLTPDNNRNFDDQQRLLNQYYDDFVSLHGCLNEPKNQKIFSEDPDSPLLFAAEDYDAKLKQAKKRDIFYTRTIYPKTIPDHADAISDAIYISMDTLGKIDPEFIQSLTKRSWESVLSETEGKIFKDPANGDWKTDSQYLSGNVVEKLSIAQKASEVDPIFSGNVAALKEVQPIPLRPHEISVRLGSSWVPTKVIRDFIIEVFSDDKTNVTSSDVSVARSADQWVIDTSYSFSTSNQGTLTKTWGTERINAIEILSKTLNHRNIEVRDKGNDGNTYINTKETLLAREKQELTQKAFKEWVWGNDSRAEQLAATYNSKFNILKERSYNGDYLTFPTMAQTLNGFPLTLYKHQRNIVSRFLDDLNVLTCHKTGAGKTTEYIASALEAKRLGKITKPLLVVPNNKLFEFVTTTLQLYPAAKVLVIDNKDISPEKRKSFAAKAALTNWDIIITTHSTFERIPISSNIESQIVEENIWEYRRLLEESKSHEETTANRISIKQIETSLKRLESKLEALLAKENKDDGLSIEQMGIDALLVDEAHRYKNLQLVTRLGHIPGVNTSASQRAFHLYSACRLMFNIHNGDRGIMLGTATPITNSLAEMYTMLRLTRHSILQSLDMNTFDDFVGTFAEVVTGLEVLPEGGGYRENSRLSRFVNLPELVKLFRLSADILPDDAFDLNVPEVNRKVNVADQSDWQALYMKYLAARAMNVRQGGVDPSVDNLLKITTDGTKAALDIRLIDPELPDLPDSKVNLMIRRVFKIWSQTKTDRLTQAIMCDLSTPKPNNFSLYQDIKDKLIALGVPPEDIAFAHDAKTKAAEEKLHARVRSGDIRIILGSTEKLGTAANIQDRLVNLEHLDIGYTPAGLKQRRGRIERPGNLNTVVSENINTTKDSIEVFRWEIIQRKDRFIAQAMTSPDKALREITEDTDPSLAEVIAITTGNPAIRVKVEIDSKVDRLRLLERAHLDSQWSTKNTIKRKQETIEYLNSAINRSSQDLDFVSRSGKELAIGASIHTDIKSAAQALIQELAKLPTGKGARKETLIGTYCDMPIKYIEKFPNSVLEIQGQTNWEIPLKKRASMAISNILGLPQQIATYVENIKQRLKHEQTSLSSLEKSVSNEFEHDEELQQAIMRQKELNEALRDTLETTPDKVQFSITEFTEALDAYKDQLHHRPASKASLSL